MLRDYQPKSILIEWYDKRSDRSTGVATMIEDCSHMRMNQGKITDRTRFCDGDSIYYCFSKKNFTLSEAISYDLA